MEKSDMTSEHLKVVKEDDISHNLGENADSAVKTEIVEPCIAPGGDSTQNEALVVGVVAGEESTVEKAVKTEIVEPFVTPGGDCEAFHLAISTDEDTHPEADNCPPEDNLACAPVSEVSSSSKRKRGRPIKYGRHGKQGKESQSLKALPSGAGTRKDNLSRKRKASSTRAKKSVVDVPAGGESDMECEIAKETNPKSHEDGGEDSKPQLRRGRRAKKRPKLLEDEGFVRDEKKKDSVTKKIAREIDSLPDEWKKLIADTLNNAKKSQQIIDCPKCLKSYRRSYIKRHILWKHSPLSQTAERPFECSDCGKAYPTQSSLINHKASHSLEKRFICDVCGQGFTQKGNMAAHKRIHQRQAGEKDYNCDDCGKGFNSKRHWEAHLKFHAGEYNFVCEICNRSFLQKDALKSHMKTHASSKPFICDVCGEGLSSVGALKNHKLIHTGEKPLECEVCGKHFRNKTTLIRHRTIHSEERPFECEVCGLAFKWPLYLLRHKLIHTDEKRFQCPDCDKGFKRREHLKLHQRTHTGEKPFTCQYCAKQFSQTCSVRQHEKIHVKKNHEKLTPEVLAELTLSLKGSTGVAVAQVQVRRKGPQGRGGKALLMRQQAAKEKTSLFYEDLDDSEGTSDDDDDDGHSDTVMETSTGSDKNEDEGQANVPFIPQNCSKVDDKRNDGKEVKLLTDAPTTTTSTCTDVRTPVSTQQNIVKQSESVGLYATNVTQATSFGNIIYSESAIPSHVEEEVETQCCVAEEVAAVTTHSASPAKVIPTDASSTTGDEAKLLCLLIESEDGPMPLLLDSAVLQNTSSLNSSGVTFVIADDGQPDSTNVISQQMEMKTVVSQSITEMPVEEMLVPSSTTLSTSLETCTAVPNKTIISTPNVVASWESPFLKSNFASSAVQVEPLTSDFVSRKFDAINPAEVPNIKLEDEAQVQEPDAPQNKFEMEFKTFCGSSLASENEVTPPNEFVDMEQVDLPDEAASFLQSSTPQEKTTDHADVSSTCGSTEVTISMVAHPGLKRPVEDTSSSYQPGRPELKSDSQVIESENERETSAAELDESHATDEEESKLEAAQLLAGMMNEQNLPSGSPDVSASDEQMNLQEEAESEASVNTPDDIWVSPTRSSSKTGHKHGPQYTHVKDGVDCDLATGKCFSCSKVFRNTSYLRHHVLMHKGIKSVFCCKICDKIFPSASNLKTHMSGHNPERKSFLCTVCGAAMASKANLQSHMRIHSRKEGEKDFQCDICGKGFNSRVHFSGHMKMHEGTYSSMCAVCGRAFATGHDLKKHMTSHSDARHFVCDICGSAVKTATALKTHKRIHTDERPYECSICRRAFRDKSTLVRHEATHSEERPHVCDICGLRFKWKLYLTRHRIIHTNVADFECETCHKRFKRREHLKLHMRIHTGEKPYQCRFCNRKFTQNSSCRTHEKMHTC